MGGWPVADVPDIASRMQRPIVFDVEWPLHRVLLYLLGLIVVGVAIAKSTSEFLTSLQGRCAATHAPEFSR
jgi:hypothetical protein